MTPKKIIIIFFLNAKGFYHIASIFDNIKERVDVNQDGPSLIIEAHRPPNSQKY